MKKSNIRSNDGVIEMEKKFLQELTQAQEQEELTEFNFQTEYGSVGSIVGYMHTIFNLPTKLSIIVDENFVNVPKSIINEIQGSRKEGWTIPVNQNLKIYVKILN